MKGTSVERGIRVLWLAAAAITIWSYAWIHAPYQRAISAESDTVRTLAASVERDAAAIAQSVSLKRIQRASLAEIANIMPESHAPITAADLLLVLAELAKHQHLRVISIQTDSTPRQEKKTGVWALPITVELQGGFVGIVHFIARLPQQRTLVGLQDAQISPATHGAPLHATIHATLYRIFWPDVREQ